MAKTYSGGMIRRLELAQALVSAPRLLILDEPTIGLDPIARTSVWEHINAVRRATGMTVLVTTHYMDEADQYCDRVALMHRGRIRALGTPGRASSRPPAPRAAGRHPGGRLPRASPARGPDTGEVTSAMSAAPAAPHPASADPTPGPRSALVRRGPAPAGACCPRSAPCARSSCRSSGTTAPSSTPGPCSPPCGC